MVFGIRAAAWPLVLALLGACASTPPRPATHQRAVELNRQGNDALRRGDAASAVRAFGEALRIERSVDREEGIALAAFNLSVAQQQIGDAAAAERSVAAVLDDPHRRYPRARMAQLAMRRAILAAARGDRAAADAALDAVDRYCDLPCAVAPARLNLQARLALADGRPGEALAAARSAVGTRGVDPVERANGWRLQAAALLALDRAHEARPPAALALEADKAAGASAKIRQDLLLLARAHADDPAAARAYAARAAEVARAVRDGAAPRHDERDGTLGAGAPDRSPEDPR